MIDLLVLFRNLYFNSTQKQHIGCENIIFRHTKSSLSKQYGPEIQLFDCILQTPYRVSQDTVNVSYGQFFSFSAITTKHRFRSKYTPQLGTLKSIKSGISCKSYSGRIAVWTSKLKCSILTRIES